MSAASERETVTQVDVRTAALRALRDRLSEISWVIEGKTSKFVKVYDTWPDPNKLFTMPACALLLSSAEIDYSGFTPYEAEEEVLGEVGNATFVVGEWIGTVVVDVWARNPIEMNVIVRTLQDTLNPDLDRFGLYIKLDDYFGQCARYSYMEERTFLSEDRVIAGTRRTSLTLKVEVPYVRPVTGLPVLEPRIQLFVGEAVDVNETSLSKLQEQGG